MTYLEELAHEMDGCGVLKAGWKLPPSRLGPPDLFHTSNCGDLE